MCDRCHRAGLGPSLTPILSYTGQAGGVGGRTRSESDAPNCISALWSNQAGRTGGPRDGPFLGITAARVTLCTIREASYSCSYTVGPNEW